MTVTAVVWALTAVVTAVLAAVLSLLPAVPLGPSETSPAAATACQEEDSPPPCVWDCRTMGNRICQEESG